MRGEIETHKLIMRLVIGWALGPLAFLHCRYSMNHDMIEPYQFQNRYNQQITTPTGNRLNGWHAIDQYINANYARIQFKCQHVNSEHSNRCDGLTIIRR